MARFWGALLLAAISLLQLVAALPGPVPAAHQLNFSERPIGRNIHERGPPPTPEEIDRAEVIVKDAQAKVKIRNQKVLERTARGPDMEIPGQEGGGSSASRVGDIQGDDELVDDGVREAAKMLAEVDAAGQAEKRRSLGFTEVEKRQAPGFWMEDVQHGKAVYGGAGYQVFRNVKDFGAVGDGITDDTAAINAAISAQARCGFPCKSSTLKPAIIYIPSGTYLVSSTIQMYYNTQVIGNPNGRPIIRAAPSFVGLGVLSSDPYGPSGQPWFLGPNNFLRQVRNLIVDIRQVPDIFPAGIHWVVAQGSSLQNIEFLQATHSTNNHQGIYMENGSGGFMTDLVFRGGNFGMYVGNQQFTSRNLRFIDCRTAIQTHWDWAWTFKGLDITGAQVGVNMVGPNVGSVLLIDSKMSNTNTAVLVSQPAATSPAAMLTIDNLKLYNVPNAVRVDGGSTLLAGTGNTVKFITSWGIGRRYTTSANTGTFSLGSNITPARTISASLLGGADNAVFSRTKPQYESLPASSFISVLSAGARGDGTTDDTAAINAVLTAQAGTGKIVYFPHGIYIVTNTIFVPVGTRIVGEAWPQLMGKGSRFMDIRTPRPVVRVGNPGDAGIVEISDMMWTVRGATAGAVLVQWNVKQSTKGSAAMWDSHFRVGGAYGSALQQKNCPKETGKISNSCIAGAMLMHLTPSSSSYMENIWAWVADHDLDIPEETQIDVYVARGILIESAGGPSWFYGTHSEHCVLYQYQTAGARDVFMSMIQTETPYYQPIPKAPLPFGPQLGKFTSDPTFADCPANSISCAMAWGLRIVNSVNVYVYGGGLYSWFSDYVQDCLDTEDCQDRMVEVDTTSTGVWVYNLVTKAAKHMIKRGTSVVVAVPDNDFGFGQTVAAWLVGSGRV